MIYFYSACGNSKWVAENVAKGTGDTAVSIVDINKSGTLPAAVKSGETLGLVFPVYAWNTPDIMLNFIDKLSIASDAYVYAVCTCGNETGLLFKKLQKKIRLDSGFSVQMPNTYIVMFDTDTEEIERADIAQAKKRIPYICDCVNGKRKIFDYNKGGAPFIKSYIEYPFFKLMIKDKAFYADDKCVSCGLCEKVCPVQNVKLTDGKPVWQGHCIHCTACINRCPEKAIQYGNATKNRGRYHFDETKYGG